jgi:hypothetical protein
MGRNKERKQEKNKIKICKIYKRRKGWIKKEEIKKYDDKNKAKIT